MSFLPLASDHVPFLLLSFPWLSAGASLNDSEDRHGMRLQRHQGVAAVYCIATLSQEKGIGSTPANCTELR